MQERTSSSQADDLFAHADNLSTQADDLFAHAHNLSTQADGLFAPADSLSVHLNDFPFIQFMFFLYTPRYLPRLVQNLYSYTLQEPVNAKKLPCFRTAV